VATFSTLLGLKLNDQSDPFELSDFVSNWGILDASPGTFVCTSTSRPSWSTAQAGRLIFMTDLKQLSYWTGTAWSDLRSAAPVFAAGVFLNTGVNAGATANYNVLTFTTPRPCALAVAMTGTYTCPNNKKQDAWQSATFDGVQEAMGSFRDGFRFAGDSADNGTPLSASVMSLTIIPSVSAGQHKIGAQVQVSSSYTTALTAVGFKVLAFIALYQAGNVL
jgi:hypothetical protein